jgi:hypothetical protein
MDIEPSAARIAKRPSNPWQSIVCGFTLGEA